jgi:N-glycosylase/DNA lyase
MTPKLYDELNTKLAKVWGDYAGWAHSVRNRAIHKNFDSYSDLILQVLFTADLKSFSSYGLPSPSASAIFTGAEGLGKEAVMVPPTPPLTPSPSPIKRKRVQQVTTAQRVEFTSAEHAAAVAIEGEEAPQQNGNSSSGGATNLADRVKKRRRVAVTATKKW